MLAVAATAIVWTVGWNTASAVIAVNTQTATTSLLAGPPRSSAPAADRGVSATRQPGRHFGELSPSQERAGVLVLGPPIILSAAVEGESTEVRRSPRSATVRASRDSLARRFGPSPAPKRSSSITPSPSSGAAAAEAAMGVPFSADSWTTPITDPYRITARFGASGSLWQGTHTGLDLAAPTGTPVRALAAGEVLAAESAGGYGLKIAVQHLDGTETWYAHLSRIDVTVGQAVEPGQMIGAVGATGNVTGPHLHLEVRPDGGDPVDPLVALRGRGITL